MISTRASSIKEENERRIDKDYSILVDKKIGKGGFGQLYIGRNIHYNTLVAIKVEDQNQRSHLIMEYHILKELQGGDGIPKVYKLHRGKNHNYLCMELLGKSLDKLFLYANRQFSIKTVSQIAYQMIQRIEYVHSKGYIHRDIKPGNFLIGKDFNSDKLYIIDFGLSKRYIDKNTNKHIIYKEGKGLTGTARYVSLNTHYGIEQSRRDDIEGIAYNIIYFAKGKLPWQGVKTKNKKEKHKKIMEFKEKYNPEKLCEELPEEFPTLLKYARKLDFNEKPDYKNIKIMFKQLISSNNEKMDWKFDWEKNSYSNSEMEEEEIDEDKEE